MSDDNSIDSFLYSSSYRFETIETLRFQMSIQLDQIDCPHLTSTFLHFLSSEFSLKTTNEYLIWIRDHLEYSSRQEFQCLQTCIIAQTACFNERKRPSSINIYSIDQPEWDMLKSSRHLIIHFQEFDQHLWNEFWNRFLLRLFEKNLHIRLKYISTNASLFDLNYFVENYLKNSERNEEILNEHFFFENCFHLERFENELRTFNNDSMNILIIDDLFSLIRPFLGLDHRLRNYVRHLTYQLNRLAQQHSLLIITGLILSKSDLSIDDFLADEYLFLKNLSTLNNEILFRSNSNNFQFNLDQWMKNST